MLALFRQMASSGTTVVIATHERDISGIIDRTVQMTDGLISTGSVPLVPEAVR
jgi:ABC-type lipoprotein export system ATPase subunit